VLHGVTDFVVRRLHTSVQGALERAGLGLQQRGGKAGRGLQQEQLLKLLAAAAGATGGSGAAGGDGLLAEQLGKVAGAAGGPAASQALHPAAAGLAAAPAGQPQPDAPRSGPVVSGPAPLNWSAPPAPRRACARLPPLPGRSNRRTRPAAPSHLSPPFTHPARLQEPAALARELHAARFEVQSVAELKLALVRVLAEVHEQLERSLAAAAAGEHQLQGLLLPCQPPGGSTAPEAGPWPAPPSARSLPQELFPAVLGTQLGQVRRPRGRAAAACRGSTLGCALLSPPPACPAGACLLRPLRAATSASQRCPAC
jgi:hypothetical protein